MRGIRVAQQRECEETRLRALREAVCVGITDIEAGRYTTLETPEQIDEHISRLTIGCYASNSKATEVRAVDASNPPCPA